MQAYFEHQRDDDQLFHIETKENDRCPAHFHSNIELLYVTEGEIDVTVNQHTKRLPAGTLAVSNSFDVHAYHTPAHSQTVFLIIPADTVEFYRRFLEKRHFESPFLYAGSHSPELENAISFLRKYDCSSLSPVSMGYICVILGILLEKLTLQPDRADMGTGNLIRRILVYLDRHYREPVTMQTLAGVFGYNRSYLSRVFNEYIGEGFSAYVNQLRTRHAARLIQTSDASMAQIAEAAGFSNTRSFNRAFMQLYKITPLSYKKHKSSPTEMGRQVDLFFQVYSYFPPSDPE